MREFAEDWESAVAKAVFKCAQCGEVAARVALVLDEPVPGESSSSRSGLIAESEFFGDWEQVVLAAGLRPVADALVDEDAAALYQVDPLWAPFFCPECRASYCHEHWSMTVIFDEEWTSWYDYTEGTCPRGHKRMVDD